MQSYAKKGGIPPVVRTRLFVKPTDSPTYLKLCNRQVAGWKRTWYPPHKSVSNPPVTSSPGHMTTVLHCSVPLETRDLLSREIRSFVLRYTQSLDLQKWGSQFLCFKVQDLEMDELYELMVITYTSSRHLCTRNSGNSARKDFFPCRCLRR